MFSSECTLPYVIVRGGVQSPIFGKNLSFNLLVKEFALKTTPSQTQKIEKNCVFDPPIKLLFSLQLIRREWRIVVW